MQIVRTADLAVVIFVLTLICGPQENRRAPDLRTTSRAVLVDVVVTDSAGSPVVGLPQSAFTVAEQGTPQTVSFFEEHRVTVSAQPVEMPRLPQDTFTNFSPFPTPPAVNVILLDSLNTQMEDQSVVHSEAVKYLKGAKAGTRSAVFTMGISLHFIQGFSDDPAVLLAALDNKKNIEVETPVMLKSQAESNAQAALPSGFQGVFARSDEFRIVDRQLRTLANLQSLAAFLAGFPGRKNILWFTEKAPGSFVFENGALTSNPLVDAELEKTYSMLGTARAAVYPMDARGTSVNAQYTAENNPKAGVSANGGSIALEDEERNSDQNNAQIIAERSGGRAFANTNGLRNVLDKIESDSGQFYTLSYVPTNAKMDGGWRKIAIRVAGGDYALSYRRGYVAVDTDLSGNSPGSRDHRAKKVAGKAPEAIDPLLPFMELGTPQTQQILYKIRIVPTATPSSPPADKKDKSFYGVDFAVDLKDLDLKLDANGQHTGALNVAMIVYDRYGNPVRREDHMAALNIKQDAYAAFEQTGVQMHWNLSVPKGNYWLRTGIYDRGSRKVGTMEIPLSAVTPINPAAK
jgi:VWFA-related protein